MLNRDQLFLCTLDDIKEKIDSAQPYPLLLAAFLLRKLLLEGSSLVDQVNRYRRLKISFQIGLSSHPPVFPADCRQWCIGDAFDPETVLIDGCYEVDLKTFLSTTVSYVEGHRHSVKDMIKFEAHVGVAVHPGRPKTPAEKALHAFDSQLQIGGQSSRVFQLRSIGRVVLRALEPLRQAASSVGRAE